MRQSDLNRINHGQIKKAGPRYAPSLDPNAPNLQIDSVLLSIGALTADDYFIKHIHDLRDDLLTAWKHSKPALADQYYKGTKATPEAIADALLGLTKAPPGSRLGPSRLVRHLCLRAEARAERLMTSLHQREATTPNQEQRARVAHDRWALDTLLGSLRQVADFVHSAAFSSIASNRLLLLGDWGTGKTHLLCDLTRDRMACGLPTLLYLAKDLNRQTEPLQALCDATGVAASPEELLQGLQTLGAESGTIGLLVIDGINEGNRPSWKGAVERLAKMTRNLTHVGVVVSCRRPFDSQIFADKNRKRWTRVIHPGFIDIEFDAQLEFFSYYDIPAPGMPLLTPEFSRPLMLRLVCETISELSKRQKGRYLRSIASGQRGMTKLLEDFVRKIGARIEDDFGLRRGSCWELLKGSTKNSKVVGIAPAMAESGRNAITKTECVSIVGKLTSWTDQSLCSSFVEHLISEGLLGEQLGWNRSNYFDEIILPYEKFSDHLIARHLLDKYLDTTSELAIHRSFYINRPLGRIFKMEWGDAFDQPGLAEAIMLEFPERVKRANLPNNVRELVFYLPKERRLVAPVQSVFLNGLYWRSSDSFSAETDHILSIYLDQLGNTGRDDAFEVLTALATRPHHPYSASRLATYLFKKDMADRDLSWSEYIRTADSQSVVFKILEWIERNESALSRSSAEIYCTLLPLLLTTTRRYVRDRATRALFLIGGRYPALLYDKTLALLTFSDPYVPERMLAASYGMSMSYWADPQRTAVRDALPQFARDLYEAVFAPRARHSTAHALMQNYALGVLELALLLDPGLLAVEERRHIVRPLKPRKSPFRSPSRVTEEEFDRVESAFRMDFENYTLGRIVKGRGNYDYNHRTYKAIRRQIRWRVGELGFTNQRFKDIDSLIERSRGYWPDDPITVDRYGKKYSWIAFFEMYGTLLNRGLLPEWHDQGRPIDADIDPSFPLPARDWIPDLGDPFVNGPTTLVDWVADGPTPDCKHILCLEQVDGIPGPWLLLDGFVEQMHEDDGRGVFTFFKGLLVDSSNVGDLCSLFNGRPYPGNSAIPDSLTDHYIFAGEIPWSRRFRDLLRPRDDKAGRQIIPVFLSNAFDQETGILLELPVVSIEPEFEGKPLIERNHSVVPAPSLCEHLELTNRARTFDLYGSNGEEASIYLFHRKDKLHGQFLYMRRDFLERYVTETGQVFCWLVWGERVPDWSLGLHDAIPQEIYSRHAHIHKRSYIWEGQIQSMAKRESGRHP